MLRPSSWWYGMLPSWNIVPWPFYDPFCDPTSPYLVRFWGHQVKLPHGRITPLSLGFPLCWTKLWHYLDHPSTLALRNARWHPDAILDFHKNIVYGRVMPLFQGLQSFWIRWWYFFLDTQIKHPMHMNMHVYIYTCMFMCIYIIYVCVCVLII